MTKEETIFVTDENPINVAVGYNVHLLNMVIDLLQIKGEVEVATNKHNRKKAYRNFRDGIETMLMYLSWSNRYDLEFIEKQMEELKELDGKFEKEKYQKLKDIFLEIAKKVRRKCPLDRDVRWLKENEVMSRVLR
ncbi:MAG: hypothetical protein J7K38_00740 [Thermoplasmata archaeon]|nr:hypothetical protein [Thermoplasmata archaeon]